MIRPDHLQWEFGAFRLDGSQHLLFRHGQLVPLSRKAVDILAVLLENHGQLVEKEALMRRVWPDSFVEESNLAVHISQLRKTLSDASGSHSIETIPRRGYRFVGEVRQPVPPPTTVLPESSAVTPPPAPTPASSRSVSWALLAIVIALAFAGLADLGLRLAHRPKPAGHPVAAATLPLAADRLVLAGFVNRTGDPVFDATLRQALSVELEQSPWLRLVPESRTQQSLRLMGHPPDAPLTPELSRQLCLRDDGEAFLDGSIVRLGAQYVLAVRAVNCRSGAQIADLETTAAGKDQVLAALGDLTGRLRTQLGESLATVQRYDTPIEEATTPSLEALQAYSLGRAAMIQKGESSVGIPFFERAVRLDPDFAMAWAALGNADNNLGETGLAASNLRRAWQLRSRVSERERLYIESHYEEFVTGDLAKTTVIYQTWAATWPDDLVPHTDLAVIDSDLGRFGPSMEQAQAALRLAPDDSQNYANLVNACLSQNRLAEAHAVIDQATARGLDSSDLHLYRYDLAFLEHNRAAMDQQLAWAAGQPGIEDLFLGHAADTAAVAGQLTAARRLTAQAVESARRAGEKETAAGYEVTAAQREALFGNPVEARRLAQAALALASDRDTKYGAAAALALAGSFPQASALAAQLDRDFPDDTFVQDLYLPVIRALVALGRKDPASALRALDVAAPYDGGVAGGLVPVYVRGLAFLAAGDGPHAQQQFDRVIAWPGVVLDSPIGALARLDRARALALEGQSSQAKAAYQDFLARWKNADPTLPILQTARTESAKLGS